MTKKKNKQKPPNVSETDTSDEELNEPKYQGKCCPHVVKGINFGRIKRALKNSNLTACNACATSTVENEVSEIWLCLQCGYRGCGRTSTEKHGIQHFKTIHSDCHALVLSSSTFIVWCYECDDEVHLQSSQNLKQCVDYIMKLATNNKAKFNGVNKNQPSKQSLIESVINEEVNMKKGSTKDSLKMNNSNKSTTASQKITVKGLKNLGNTCFFNSVMQNLCQTPFLLQELETCTSPTYIFEVPSFVVEDDAVIEEEVSLKLSLPKHQPLVNSLLNFLQQMSTPSTTKGIDVFNPSYIFSEISKKWPRFRHFQQEDSHELLRQLLDGVRQDEIKRQRISILRHLDLYGVNSKDVPDDSKKVTKAYSPFTNHTIVEQIFGGVLISTVLCEECKKASQVFEPFMDISLPLFEEKPLRNGKTEPENEDNEYILNNQKKDHNKPSKHQERKMKEMARKEKKKSRKLQTKGNANLKADSTNTDDIGLVNGFANDIDTLKDTENKDSRLNEVNTNQDAKNCIDGSSSELVTKNNHHSSIKSELLNLNSINDVDNLSHPDSGEDPDCSILFREEDCSGTKIEVSNFNHVTESKRILLCENEKERLSEVETQDISFNHSHEHNHNCSNTDLATNNTHTKEEVDWISLCKVLKEVNCKNGNGELSDCKDTKLENESSPNTDREESPVFFCSESNTNEVLMESHEDKDSSVCSNDSNAKKWVEKSLNTLGSRSHTSPLECSVDSCLVHFTKPELLAGSNKFRCDNCTKIKCLRTGNERDVVYTNASKQLLVFSPPAVLTLHLKRFQQVGMSLRKVNKFVEFSSILDLAPYCSYACLILPHMSSVKRKVLYSLYGVVEHTGRLNSGHYTAYVKVNKRTLNRTFLNQLPMQWDFEQLLLKFPKDVPQEEEDEDDTVPEKACWYYISDTHVREASEAQVLKCQAYLLFYERIK